MLRLLFDFDLLFDRPFRSLRFDFDRLLLGLPLLLPFRDFERFLRSATVDLMPLQASNLYVMSLLQRVESSPTRVLDLDRSGVLLRLWLTADFDFDFDLETLRDSDLFADGIEAIVGGAISMFLKPFVCL